MTLYYDKYKCDKCEREYNLAAGAVYCPHCGGALRRVRSGKARTARTLHFLRSAAFGAGAAVVALNHMGAHEAWAYALGAVLAAAGALSARPKRKGAKRAKERMSN